MCWTAYLNACFLFEGLLRWLAKRMSHRNIWSVGLSSLYYYLHWISIKKSSTSVLIVWKKETNQISDECLDILWLLASGKVKVKHWKSEHCPASYIIMYNYTSLSVEFQFILQNLSQPKFCSESESFEITEWADQIIED